MVARCHECTGIAIGEGSIERDEKAGYQWQNTKPKITTDRKYTTHACILRAGIARYNKRKQYLARRQAEADNAAAELDKLQEEAKVMRVRIEKLVKQNRDLHKQVARTDPILKKIIEVIGIEQLRRIMTMKKNNMKKVKHLPLNNVSERCPKRSHA